MVALLVARCLVERGDDVRIVSRRKGPLLADYAQVAPTRRELLAGVRRRLWLVRALAPLAWLVDVLCSGLTLLRHRPDLVYLNTSASAVYLHAARWLRRPVVLHFHESGANTAILLAEARVGDLDGVRLIACSPSVHAHLVTRTGRPHDAVALLASVPDDRRVRERAGAVRGARDDSALRVGAVGSVGHRKGTDLWLRVAERVRATPAGATTTFAWVGDLGDSPAPDPVPGVELRGPSENPYPFIADLDVFTLTSRDDPFPLVVLESMLLGTPVVAFDVGSVKDQVGDGGLVVAPEDVDAFAAAVQHLLDDDGARRAAGARARARADALYSTAAFERRLLEILTDILDDAPHVPRIAARQSR